MVRGDLQDIVETRWVREKMKWASAVLQQRQISFHFKVNKLNVNINGRWTYTAFGYIFKEITSTWLVGSIKSCVLSIRTKNNGNDGKYRMKMLSDSDAALCVLIFFTNNIRNAVHSSLISEPLTHVVPRTWENLCMNSDVKRSTNILHRIIEEEAKNNREPSRGMQEQKKEEYNLHLIIWAGALTVLKEAQLSNPRTVLLALT
ncbi:unnamed protein product [Dovyalis caffra]|uniref:Uncharacterized protein n=1 Tax=Dovyalis caffra TaxID=77055 RepID=A0AAV1RHQ7_9ROSI|nr:unnamed protein product [Dovyalis caffra]